MLALFPCYTSLLPYSLGMRLGAMSHAHSNLLVASFPDLLKEWTWE